MSQVAEWEERFASPVLDPQRWIASYRPVWSSPAAAAATYTVEPDGLVLTIPPDQSLWCPDLHKTPLRVSAVQTGNWSGPVGNRPGLASAAQTEGWVSQRLGQSSELRTIAG